MLEHMTLATSATGLIGLGVGTIIGGVLRGGKIGRLRETLEARDHTIESHAGRIESLGKELNGLGDRCSQLRTVAREKDQANEKLARRIAELEPHADAHRKTLAQRAKALTAANAANARRAAAKAGDVRPIKARG